MSGRPPVSFGVWPDMIAAAKGAGRLAVAIGCSPRNLRRVFTGVSSGLSGARAELARAFAEDHGVVARLYVHPSVPGWLLLSTASGWFELPNAPGGWAQRQPRSRGLDDWSGLSSLELDFGSSWACLSGGTRPDLGHADQRP